MNLLEYFQKAGEFFMLNFFNPDSPLMRFLSKMADLMILNLTFVVTCIPVVTIGPALTALNYVTLRMADGKDAHIIRSYFKSFRENFRQALFLWLAMLLFAWVLWFDAANFWNAAGAHGYVLRIFTVIAIIGYVLVFLYAFPLLACFHNTLVATLLNAIRLALSAIHRTVSMFVLIAACVMLTFYTWDTIKFGLFLWLVLGFASLSYANAFLLRKTFDHDIDQPAEEENL